MFEKLILYLLPFFKGTKADFATYRETEKHSGSSVRTEKLQGGTGSGTDVEESGRERGRARQPTQGEPEPSSGGVLSWGGSGKLASFSSS